MWQAIFLTHIFAGRVDLEIRFPDQYPFEPPKVRVVKPRFKPRTGFVINGALCMELLSKDGWTPAMSVVALIQSIKGIFWEGKGRLDLPDEVALTTPGARFIITL